MLGSNTVTGARWFSLVAVLAACGDDMGGETDAGAAAVVDAALSVDADNSAEASDAAPPAAEQLPPQGAAALEAWLAEGHYLDWHCESAVHASRSPSPHGFNRICSNDAIAQHAAEAEPWPRGAAAVKEIYDGLDGREPTGYAVYIKTDEDSSQGANWYWYERIAGGAIPADGLGDGPAKSVCVACHAAAGADPAHTPTPGARDQVYTPVE